MLTEEQNAAVTNVVEGVKSLRSALKWAEELGFACEVTFDERDQDLVHVEMSYTIKE